MNDPISASGGADDERRSRSRREFISSFAVPPVIRAVLLASASPAPMTPSRLECVTWSEENATYNRVASLMRVLGALIGALAFYLVLASPANAAQIKVQCKVYATNHVDPIAHAHHLHRQIGNTSTTNESTGKSLFNNRSTSCDQEWFTSAGWFPVERYESVRDVNVYYRAPGDQRSIKAIPKGLQLLGTSERYVCNDDGSGDGLQSTPVYWCKSTWATEIAFPDCINTSRLANEATNAVYSRRGVCPSTHPYRIPRINYLVMHQNTNGVVPNPLTVSMGEGEWGPWSNMHADYFAANQPELNEELLDLCLRDAPDNVLHADPRCGRKP
jgi:Domain of unknown function (DUF1996)